jgi:hypothetical protein
MPHKSGTLRIRQPIRTGLGTLHVLCHCTPAYTDSTKQIVVLVQGQSTTEDHQPPVGLLDSIQWLVGLRLVVQSSAGDAIKKHACSGFLDGNVNAAWECVVHAQESDQ